LVKGLCAAARRRSDRGRHGNSGRRTYAGRETKYQPEKSLSKKKVFDEGGGSQNKHNNNEQQKCG
jgi:hypothetical protein